MTPKQALELNQKIFEVFEDTRLYKEYQEVDRFTDKEYDDMRETLLVLSIVIEHVLENAAWLVDQWEKGNLVSHTPTLERLTILRKALQELK